MYVIVFVPANDFGSYSDKYKRKVKTEDNKKGQKYSKGRCNINRPEKIKVELI